MVQYRERQTILLDAPFVVNKSNLNMKSKGNSRCRMHSKMKLNFTRMLKTV